MTWTPGPQPQPPLPRQPPASPPAPENRNGCLVVGLVAVVAFGLAAVVIAAAAVFVAVDRSSGENAGGEVVVDDPAGPDQPAPGPSDPADRTPPVIDGDERLAPEPALPTEDGPYDYLATDDIGEPLRWDPCQSIRYVVNDRKAPEGAMSIMGEAIEQIEAATGLVFEEWGATDEPPPVGEDRRLTDEGRYGPGWSPVLITWIDPDEDPELTDAAGLASPQSAISSSGDEVYVTGYVEMASSYASGLISAGRRDDVLGVMMHELGHLIGLGHVSDSTQVMTDDPDSTPSVWGGGDLYALAQAGRGECYPDI